jgi:hypothetical protein
MGDVIWTAPWIAVALIGGLIMVRGKSVSWRLAGVAYALTGIGTGTYVVVTLTSTYEPPFDSSTLEVAVWFALGGFFAGIAAVPLTLIALGRGGRRQFALVFAAATLTIGVYEFWTSNWAARTADATTRCIDTGHYGPGRIQRIPPGVHCVKGDRFITHERGGRKFIAPAGGDVFVAVDAICWLALVGWSTFYGLLATFPLMGLAWAARRRPILKPA